MKFTPRFTTGDAVMVVGPMLTGGKGPKKPREGIVRDVDKGDPCWTYQVRFAWRGDHETRWFREENVQPLVPLVPKFTTQAEADAWLEANS